jgi:uroporphyrinogen decarboxylase
MSATARTTKREQVIKAVEFEGPDYVPVYRFNRDFQDSDIVSFDVQHHFEGPGADASEWGFRWRRLDETMGQPTQPLLQDWEERNALKPPDPQRPDRFAGLDAFLDEYPEHFRLASLALSGFTTMSFLRGFDNLMMDLIDRPEQVCWLADCVFGFETEIIRSLPEDAFDAVAFFDDWGTQTGPIISPSLWQRIFKPRYAQQFAEVHQRGLYVYFHTCGQVWPIIPDLLECGVDILNISQPNLYDIPRLGERYGGRVCFVCPVSYQTTSITGTPAEIFRDVQEVIDHLGRFNGGLIGYVEEYGSIGMPEENYSACVAAFRELGRLSEERV